MILQERAIGEVGSSILTELGNPVCFCQDNLNTHLVFTYKEFIFGY